MRKLNCCMPEASRRTAESAELRLAFLYFSRAWGGNPRLEKAREIWTPSSSPFFPFVFRVPSPLSFGSKCPPHVFKECKNSAREERAALHERKKKEVE
jgi:hypothetical protein